MSEDWKDQLKHVYKNLQQDQKNKKGLQSKFDKTVGYKNKTGFNDTGIPLTAKAARSLEKNRAAYTGRRSRRSNYEGTTLQQINEERAAAAKERWKHLDKKSGSRHSSDTSRKQTRDYSSSELTWRNSLTREGEGSWYNSPTTFRGYGYDSPYSEEKESVTYIAPVERKEPEYKPKVSVDHNGNLKFKNKVEEAIYNLKNGKR